MIVPPGKTPISYLQELCTKRGLTPQYDLISNDGAVHKPLFVIRVTVGEIIATGKGTSKKKAKHGAAQEALCKLLGVASNGEEVEQKANGITARANTDESGSYTGEGAPGNPIGELHEFSQKTLIKPPIYSFDDEQGPSHAREFVCTVKLGKHTEKGTGKSKKAAKREAAFVMLQYIRNLDAQNQAKHEDELDEDDDIPLPSEMRRSAYRALKQGKKIPTTTPQQNAKIHEFYERMMKMGGKATRALQVHALNTPSTNFCLMLQQIAESQRFEVNYMDIKEISVSGLHQCLVQLSTDPISVCHGSGPTIDEAHAGAAHNALQYLKLMMKAAS